jgi:hypothetical protein
MFSSMFDVHSEEQQQLFQPNDVEDDIESTVDSISQ